MIEFLGMEIDSRSLELRVPGKKQKKIIQEATKINNREPSHTAREVSRLLGKLTSVSEAIPPGPLCFAGWLERSGVCTREEQSVVRWPLSTVGSGKRRAHLVERPTDQVEQEGPGSKEPGPASHDSLCCSFIS